MPQILSILQRDKVAEGHKSFCVRPPQRPGQSYDPDEVFNPKLENSQLLDRLMPCSYFRYTLDNMELAQEVNYSGMEFKNKEHLAYMEEIRKWGTMTGTVGTKVSLYLVPKGSGLCGPGDNLRKIGIITDATTKAKQTGVQKRLKRALAHHAHFSFCTPSSTIGRDFTMKNSKGLSFVCYMGDETPDNNGMHLATRMAWSAVTGIPLEWIKAGQIFKITVLGPFGMVKGHVFIKETMTYDFVFNGVKPELRLENLVFIGDLCIAKTGDAYSDVQAIINFGLEELLMKDLIWYNHEVFEACQDDNKLFRMLSRMVEVSIDAEDQAPDPDTEWLMVMLRRFGVSHRFEPGLFKRFYETALHKVMDMGGRKLRIPMWRHARRGYLMPEVLALDNHGLIDQSKVLIGKDVCIPWLKEGWVVMYRQPSGNPNEFVIAWNRHVPEYMELGNGVVYLGYEMAIEALKRMGGGDYDDPVVITDDEEWVNHFRNLKPYPASN